MGRRSISKKLRYEILKRDKSTCQVCGRKRKDGVKLHVDHIIPVSRGGTDDPSNLQTLCRDCNLGKSNTLEADDSYLEKVRKAVNQDIPSQSESQGSGCAGRLEIQVEPITDDHVGCVMCLIMIVIILAYFDVLAVSALIIGGIILFIIFCRTFDHLIKKHNESKKIALDHRDVSERRIEQEKLDEIKRQWDNFHQQKHRNAPEYDGTEWLSENMPYIIIGMLVLAVFGVIVWLIAITM